MNHSGAKYSTWYEIQTIASSSGILYRTQNLQYTTAEALVQFLKSDVSDLYGVVHVISNKEINPCHLCLLLVQAAVSSILQRSWDKNRAELVKKESVGIPGLRSRSSMDSQGPYMFSIRILFLLKESVRVWSVTCLHQLLPPQRLPFYLIRQFCYTLVLVILSSCPFCSACPLSSFQQQPAFPTGSSG